MPRSGSKAEILKRLHTQRKRLEQTLARLSPEEMLRAGVVDKSSVKDVLAHLADWEARMPLWVNAARAGDPVASPDPGLTWEQLDLLNERIYQAHCNQSLAEVLGYFRTAHEQFMLLVLEMPEDEMLTRSRYDFTGKDAIYDWLESYAKHDEWGKQKIREWMLHSGRRYHSRQEIVQSSI